MAQQSYGPFGPFLEGVEARNEAGEPLRQLPLQEAIQPSALVGDLSQAARPFPVRFYGIRAVSPAVAAERSAISVRAGTNGALVEEIRAGVTAVTFAFLSRDSLLFTLAPVDLVPGYDVAEGGPLRSVVSTGSFVAATIPANSPGVSLFTNFGAPVKFWIPPLMILFLADDTDNAALSLDLWVRDIPVDPDGS